MAPSYEGEQDRDRTVSLPADAVLKALGLIPGGMADADTVRLAAQVHGLDLSAPDGGVHYVDDQPGVAANSLPVTEFKIVDRGQAHAAGQAGNHDRAETALLNTSGLPFGANRQDVERDQHDHSAGTALGAPVAPVAEDNPWDRPAGSILAGREVAVSTSPDLSQPGDLARLYDQNPRHVERRGGRRLVARPIALISAAALAAALSGGVAFLDHDKHVGFNHAVEDTVSVPAYVPQGTVAQALLEGDVSAIQQALVDPAISANRYNDLQHNRVYNDKLGEIILSILLQVGGGDPQTSGDPGVIWPLTPKTEATDYQILAANERARGEPVSPNNANDPAVDARLVAVDMNRFFASQFQPGDTPGIVDLARAYGNYEATQLGAPRNAATIFGQSTANLVTQSGLTFKQYQALKPSNQQYAALEKDTTWLKHMGEVGNKVAQGS